MLTRYVKACCPQQAIDEYTPDAWHDLLGDLSFDDCRRAVAAAGKLKPFVAPAEIRAEVRRIRNERLDHQILSAPPAELADEPGRYKAALEARISQIADGRSMRRALGRGTRSGEPPREFTGARAELGTALERDGSLSPQEIARRQAAQSRAIRAEHEDPPARPAA
jgi:hypothetical protein